jgi:probable F420-dependent oxidoreductase
MVVMRFGFILPNFGGRITAKGIVRISQKAEEAGFESVFATDHIVMPRDMQEPYGNLVEPMMLLSFVAARTTKLKLGTSVIVLPQRNPVLVAKQATALDVLSNGRIILGLGAGWAEKEFAYLNADFKRRGKVFDESIELMRSLWSGEPVDFLGRFFKINGAIFLPKPVQERIPIWIGGSSDSALRRAARLGDGWHPVGPNVETYRKGVERIKRTRRQQFTYSVRMTVDVRKRREDYVSATGEKRITVSGTGRDLRKGIGEFEKVGLDYFVASILHPREEDIIADIKTFSKEVIRSYL